MADKAVSSWLTVARAKLFRDFAFPSALSNPAHTPHFSIEDLDKWVSSEAFEAYEAWKKRKVQEADEDIDVTNIDIATLKEFRQHLLPLSSQSEPFFSLDNVEMWFKSGPFLAMLYSRSPGGRSAHSLHVGARNRDDVDTFWSGSSQAADSRPSSRMSLASDTSLEVPPGSPQTEHEVIEILSSDDEESRPTTIQARNRALDARLSRRQVKIESDDDEVVLVATPVTIQGGTKRGRSETVSSVGSSLSEEADMRNAKAQKTEGTFRLTKKLTVGRLKPVAEIPRTWPVPRNSAAYLVDFEHVQLPQTNKGAQMTMDAFIRHEDQDSWRGSTGHLKGDVGVYGLVPEDPTQSTLCRRVALNCQGIKVCEQFDEGLLAGCERYEKDEDETCEFLTLEGDANESEASSTLAAVARFWALIQQTTCSVHCNGEPTLRKLKKKNRDGKSVFVGCTGWHLQEKYKHRYLSVPWNIDEELLKQVFKNNGTLPSGEDALSFNEKCVLSLHPTRHLETCTFSHVVGARSTSCLLDGKALAAVAPAYSDRRRIRNMIRTTRNQEFPYGEDYDVGSFNEWKVTGFDDRFQRRIIYMTAYSNHEDRAAFDSLWSSLFKVTEKNTGRPLRIQEFFPDDPTSRLLAIILDGDLAQALALGDYLVQYLSKYVSDERRKTLPSDPMELAKLILKFCLLHSQRNIEQLRKGSDLSEEDAQRLKSFPGLGTDDEIADWHRFCQDLQKTNTKVKDWYQQKLNNPFLLTCINQYLSPMSKENWDLTPRDTNLVEGAHAMRNMETSTHLPLLRAILTAQEADNKLAEELESMKTSLIAHRHQNGPAKREKLSAQRRQYVARQTQQRNTHLDEFFSLQQQLTKLKDRIAQSLENTKLLDHKQKEALANFASSSDPDNVDLGKQLKNQIKGELAQRRVWNTEVQDLQARIKGLKSGPLKGVSIPKTPSLRTENSAGVELATTGESSATSNQADLDANLQDGTARTPSPIPMHLDTRGTSDLSYFDEYNSDFGSHIVNEGSHDHQETSEDAFNPALWSTASAGTVDISTVLPLVPQSADEHLPFVDDFDFSPEMMERVAETAQQFGPLPMNWMTDPGFFKSMYTNPGLENQ
ncbi:hypothetical protein MD484_g7252, partial [Candolleomyces efflorescens]